MCCEDEVSLTRSLIDKLLLFSFKYTVYFYDQHLTFNLINALMISDLFIYFLSNLIRAIHTIKQSCSIKWVVVTIIDKIYVNALLNLLLFVYLLPIFLIYGFNNELLRLWKNWWTWAMVVKAAYWIMKLIRAHFEHFIYFDLCFFFCCVYNILRI